MKRRKINEDIAGRVLSEAGWWCCVCRSRAAQIHHLDEDASNDDYENLAALCFDCHDEAHTTHKLRRNLTPKMIRRSKADWKDILRQIGRSPVAPVADRGRIENPRNLFPYPYGSDLHWFWGWGQRICAYVNKDHGASEYVWMLFRPDGLARNAMMEFSIVFPMLIKQVDDYLTATEKAFADFLKHRDNRSADHLVESMSLLLQRIYVAADIISHSRVPRITMDA